MNNASESESAPASRESLTLTLLDAISGDGTTTATTPLPLVFEKHSPLPPDLVKPVWVDEEPTRPMPVRRHRLRSASEVPNPDPIDTGIHDLPPNLTIKLGECIGHGRSGLIFKVEPIQPIESPSSSGSPGSSSTNTPSTTTVRPPPPPPVLPALVAKIGRQHFHKWLLREAWFYEEMQSLQGVVIPVCYGLYSALIPSRIDHATSFIPWPRPWLEGWRLREFNAKPVSPEVLLHTYEKRAGKDRADEREVEGEADMLDYFGDFDDKYAEFVQKFEDTSQKSTSTDTGGTVCTLLLLEELDGPYLPMGRRVPDEMREEILKAYAQIHELGIDHNDLTYWNILVAPSPSSPPPSPSSSPLSPSPSNPSRDHSDPASPSHSVSSSRCKCRIIDFELASKMNITAAGLAQGSTGYLDRLLRNLPAGMIVGQNNK